MNRFSNFLCLLMVLSSKIKSVMIGKFFYIGVAFFLLMSSLQHSIAAEQDSTGKKRSESHQIIEIPKYYKNKEIYKKVAEDINFFSTPVLQTFEWLKNHPKDEEDEDQLVDSLATILIAQCINQTKNSEKKPGIFQNFKNKNNLTYLGTLLKKEFIEKHASQKEETVGKTKSPQIEEYLLNQLVIYTRYGQNLQTYFDRAIESKGSRYEQVHKKELKNKLSAIGALERKILNNLDFLAMLKEDRKKGNERIWEIEQEIKSGKKDIKGIMVQPVAYFLQEPCIGPVRSIETIDDDSTHRINQAQKRVEDFIHNDYFFIGREQSLPQGGDVLVKKELKEAFRDLLRFGKRIHAEKIFFDLFWTEFFRNDFLTSQSSSFVIHNEDIMSLENKEPELKRWVEKLETKIEKFQNSSPKDAAKAAAEIQHFKYNLVEEFEKSAKKILGAPKKIKNTPNKFYPHIYQLFSILAKMSEDVIFLYRKMEVKSSLPLFDKDTLPSIEAEVMPRKKLHHSNRSDIHNVYHCTIKEVGNKVLPVLPCDFRLIAKLESNTPAQGMLSPNAKPGDQGYKVIAQTREIIPLGLKAFKLGVALESQEKFKIVWPQSGPFKDLKVETIVDPNVKTVFLFN